LSAFCAKPAAQGKASAKAAPRARFFNFAVDADGMSLREFVVGQNLFNIVLCRAHIRAIKRQRAGTQRQHYHEGDQQLPTHRWLSPFGAIRNADSLKDRPSLWRNLCMSRKT
jgi:hypothetical protein